MRFSSEEGQPLANPSSLVFFRSDEGLYLLVLFLSLGAGFAIRRIADGPRKGIVASLSGFALILGLCGADALYSLVAAAINTVVVRRCGRRRHVASFLFAFAFLGAFRCADRFGLPTPRPLANAVQLVLTLKMVALAFEVNDAHEAKAIIESVGFEDKAVLIRLERLRRVGDPTWLQSFGYYFCYVGVFTGPFFKYGTYLDWLDDSDRIRSLSTLPFLLRNLAPLPAVAVVHLVTKIYFPLDHVDTPSFAAEPFWRRVFYMVPTFIVFRTRMYVAWLLAECVAIAAAFGAYPKKSQCRPGEGPRDLIALKEATSSDVSAEEYDFVAIKNIDIKGVELEPTARGAMRCWNMSVQFWLAQFVYKRFPIRSLGTAVTMLVSAYWHGVHAGYYLSFLTVPLVVAVDDAWGASLRHRLDSWHRGIFDWVSWFLRCRAYDYMCMGFLLLSYDRTMAYWRSIYFVVHIVYFILLLAVIPLKTLSSMFKEDSARKI